MVVPDFALEMVVSDLAVCVRDTCLPTVQCSTRVRPSCLTDCEWGGILVGTLVCLLPPRTVGVPCVLSRLLGSPVWDRFD